MTRQMPKTLLILVLVGLLVGLLAASLAKTQKLELERDVLQAQNAHQMEALQQRLHELQKEINETKWSPDAPGKAWSVYLNERNHKR